MDKIKEEKLTNSRPSGQNSLSFSNDRLKKIKELHTKRDEIIKHLEILHKNFRGVHHEDSASEIKYAQIKVYESFVESLNAEIKQLESENNDQTNIN